MYTTPRPPCSRPIPLSPVSTLRPRAPLHRQENLNDILLIKQARHYRNVIYIRYNFPLDYIFIYGKIHLIGEEIIISPPWSARRNYERSTSDERDKS